MTKKLMQRFWLIKEITSLLKEMPQEVCSLRNKEVELIFIASYQQSQISILQRQKTMKDSSLTSKLDAEVITFKVWKKTVDDKLESLAENG